MFDLFKLAQSHIDFTMEIDPCRFYTDHRSVSEASNRAACLMLTLIISASCAQGDCVFQTNTDLIVSATLVNLLSVRTALRVSINA